LRERGNAFPNDFRRHHLAADLHRHHGAKTNDELEGQAIAVAVAGRMLLKRVMGKASFATLQDMSGRIQLYISNDATGESVHAAFKHWDLGDILGAEGVLFKTRTGELTVKVTSLRLLCKSLRPLPEKFHGLADQEQRYRQRYVDLIVTPESRRIFKIRSNTIQSLRAFLAGRGYLEVETPM
ncbi:MAG: lysine--tRNA ligase, partial [Burkholderiales bacterium]|nr:lysine--tRNA ligase [Burkholderiales bacterium]